MPNPIQLFILTAKYLSITKAARECCISQPTASRQLAQFQESLGTKFLREKGGRIALTKAGQDYLDKVAPIWSQLEAVHKEYRRNEKSFILAGTHGPCTHLLPSLVEEFTQKHPSTRPNTRIGSSAEIEDWLLNSDTDLAVVSNRPVSPSIQIEPFRYEELVAFIAPANPLTKKKSLSTSEFGDIKLIVKVRRNGQSRSETQLSEFEKRGIKFKTVLRFESSQSVKEAVKHGTGVGILFRDTIKPEIDQGEFVAIQFAGLNVTRQTYIAYSKERPLSPPARDFLSLLRASASKNVCTETASPPVSNKRRNRRSPDYVLRFTLLSWITSAASLDWTSSVLL